MIETTYELNPTDASEIAGLNVVATYTKIQAANTLDDYAKKIWRAAQVLGGLTLNPITINVSSDWKTLDYSATDGSEKGIITLNADGYSLTLHKGD